MGECQSEIQHKIQQHKLSYKINNVLKKKGNAICFQQKGRIERKAQENIVPRG